MLPPWAPHARSALPLVATVLLLLGQWSVAPVAAAAPAIRVQRLDLPSTASAASACGHADPVGTARGDAECVSRAAAFAPPAADCDAIPLRAKQARDDADRWAMALTNHANVVTLCHYPMSYMVASSTKAAAASRLLNSMLDHMNGLAPTTTTSSSSSSNAHAARAPISQWERVLLSVPHVASDRTSPATSSDDDVRSGSGRGSGSERTCLALVRQALTKQGFTHDMSGAGDGDGLRREWMAGGALANDKTSAVAICHADPGHHKISTAILVVSASGSNKAEVQYVLMQLRNALRKADNA